MDKLFRRLPLTAKLMMMALIPLALLVFFAIQIYREKSDKIGVLNSYLQRIELSAVISNATDDLQAERRYSFGFVINNQFQTELLLQRVRTDSTLSRLNRIEQLKDIRRYTFLDSLSGFRNLVDQKKLVPSQVMNYYTNALFRINSQNIVSAGSTSYLEPVKGELVGQKLLSEMVTHLGIIRGDIYLAMHPGQELSRAMDNVKQNYDIFRSFEREFFQKASLNDIVGLKNLADSTSLKPTLTYIDHVVNNKSLDSTYDAETWWSMSASAVDELRKMQRLLLQKTREGVLQIYETEKKVRDRSLLFLILSLVAVFGIMILVINSISKSLSNLTQAARRLARGESNIEIEIESHDAIGQLTGSILEIDNNNKSLSSAASAIGSGQFDVNVVPRSAEDELGNAVVKMKNDLEVFNRENEEKLWIHSGIEKINESLRGEKETGRLSNDALTAFVEYVGGQVGLLYTASGQYLELKGRYAIEDAQMLPEKLMFGETLLGQAAQQKKLMHLKNIPDDFIKIKTATGNAVPRNVLVIPLVHDGTTEGVMEIGTLDAFEPQVLSFISQVTPAIAIALQTSRNRQKLQELFEQTQAQAEELQAQHSELENINAELEAQTEKLQASEEELKVQQEELMQANQEMEERSRLLEERNQMIVEQNLQIQQKAEELAQSTRYKSEFLANMSHELRTPLNSVLLLSRLLAENNDKNLNSDQVEYAKVIQGSGQALLSLIDEILDLSKIEAGKMELEYHPVLLQEIVNDMSSLFQPMAKEKRLELLIETDAQLPSQIETDKMRLEQVLKNLLSNALKFTSKGSVKLEIKPHDKNPSLLVFKVTDTGIGIAKEKQALIFEAFQQEDGSTRRKYGGTGLGLSISRELTRLLGGQIYVESEPGKGSSFRIEIPVSKKIAEETKESSPENILLEEEVAPAPLPSKFYRSEDIPQEVPDDREHIQAGDKTILVIEDDTSFAKALLDYTRSRGYKGLVAVRGDEGISLAKQFRPSGILLDIMLPVKDGWEVMEEIKSDPSIRHIPVHMMSSIEAKKESRLKGAVDFINKPVAFEQMQEVFKKIEHVLSKESKKVLIVEENPKHAKALAYFLESFQVNTEISHSVDKGVSMLHQNEADCVILDMGIPDANAYETLEGIKKMPGMEQLPIIIFTGKSLSKNEEMRIRQYADSIVIKTAQSYQRILDEVSLFLHLVEENKSKQKQANGYKRLGAMNEVLAGKKVLVTDDDVRNIFSLTKALELHNMQVITAVDGKEALKQLEANPDTAVVLMDIMMPEMDGYEAMQNIRKQKAFKKLPIIAVTAKAMSGDREKCIKAGASDYISKPVDIDQLMSLLRVWLYDKSI
jgi:signal transduction histidine kinase/DNA-binding response OmpR family regulator